MTTTAKIQKWGNSQGIRIPKFILEQIDLDTNSNVSIVVKDDSIIIKKATKRHIPLAERFANYDGEIPTGEYDWGEPQGDEVW
jgi:antitoxin MazE